MFVFGALGSAVLIWPYLMAIEARSLTAVFVLGTLLSGVVYASANAVWPAFYGEMFPTRVRLSGMAIGTQIGFALGGFAPTIGAALMRPGPSGWVPAAVLTSLAALVAAGCAATARETCRIDTRELGALEAREARRT